MCRSNSLPLLLCSALLCSGCQSEISGQASPTGLTERETRKDAATPGVDVFDFGTVLSKGQILHHVFSIPNPGKQSLQVLGAEAVVPCCSDIESAPKSVPPGGTAPLRVTFSAGQKKGRKKVGFVVRTDSPTDPVRRFLLIADFKPEFEVRILDESSASLSLGREGRQQLTVITRRVGDEGLDAPESLDVRGPLSASFDGPSREKRVDGMTETESTIQVTLSASNETGPQAGTLRFHWPDGQEREYSVHWDVEPWILAAPSGFVLKAEDGSLEQTVVIRSRDRPFRVLKVSGPVETPADKLLQEPRSMHWLRLKVVPDQARSVSDIRIETDLPEQPVVVLSVLVIQPSGGPS